MGDVERARRKTYFHDIIKNFEDPVIVTKKDFQAKNKSISAILEK